MEGDCFLYFFRVIEYIQQTDSSINLQLKLLRVHVHAASASASSKLAAELKATVTLELGERPRGNCKVVRQTNVCVGSSRRIHK